MLIYKNKFKLIATSSYYLEVNVFSTKPFLYYFCTKCQCLTSGIIPKDKEKDTRWCVSCRSQLLQCENCFSLTSTTIKGNETICDRCQKPAIKTKSVTVRSIT